VNRLKFLCMLASGILLAFPLVAQGQTPERPVIGFLAAGTPSGWAHLVDAFNAGLAEEGYKDGENVTVEYRWAEGKYDRLPALASDLVERRVAAMLAGGGRVAALAAKNATSTIPVPVIFVMGNDPVSGGIVPNLSRPGGNVTGVTLFSAELGAKRVELMRELVPDNAAVGLLENPKNPNLPKFMQRLREAVRAGGQRLLVKHATNAKELEAAFKSFAGDHVGALLVSPDPFFNSDRPSITALSTRYKIPTIYTLRDYVVAGGFMSYGSSFAGGYHKGGKYIGRILKGAKPDELPVLQPKEFELVINFKTAKALGITVPPMLLVRANEVIE
jgi:putative ABC transport system substrate-binding protein